MKIHTTYNNLFFIQKNSFSDCYLQSSFYSKDRNGISLKCFFFNFCEFKKNDS